ncbi:hypothetical protein [Limnospira fusiformis]|uniref:Uncharacterized protein n=1 Tax=Limnospira fusiformis PMC 851.14 TaxID=2219512 RepID=A0ABU9EU33_LIMFS|nr:hypothetical protein HFV01_09335 [Limnospira fusiformis SAG 85.79]
MKPEQQRAIAYLSRLGGGTEPNTTISPLYWVSPSFHPSYLCWVSPEQQRAIAYLSRLGGGTEPNTTISPLCWVSPSFHPTPPLLGETRATKSDRLFK